MKKNDTIRVTDFDYTRILNVIHHHFGKTVSRFPSNIRDLLEELKRAEKVDSYSIPPDYVTMNSVFRIKDMNDPREYEFRLVFPNEADMEKRKISIFAPIGTAVLGYKEGDVVKWTVPDGEKQFRIDKVVYQPEASGDYHL